MRHSTKDNYLYLTTTPVPRLIVSLAVPTIISMLVTSFMMLQTIRKPVKATIISSARQGLFFIPLIFILPHYLGLQGVEMCQATADLLTFILAIPLTCSVLNEMKRKQAEQL